MANTSVDQFLDTLHGVLSFAGNTGSVNLYMVHGGTNFGYTAGKAPPMQALCRL
jgi:beta-galactosidase